MSHKKFGPDRFNRFDVYWIQKQTNKQTNKQTDRQTDKPKSNLYVFFIFCFYNFFQSWKTCQLMREHFIFLVFDTFDVVYNW